MKCENFEISPGVYSLWKWSISTFSFSETRNDDFWDESQSDEWGCCIFKAFREAWKDWNISRCAFTLKMIIFHFFLSWLWKRRILKRVVKRRLILQHVSSVSSKMKSEMCYLMRTLFENAQFPLLPLMTLEMTSLETNCEAMSRNARFFNILKS